MIQISKKEKAFLFTLVEQALLLATKENRMLGEKDVSAILACMHFDDDGTLIKLESDQENDVRFAQNKILLEGVLQEKMGAFVSYYRQMEDNQGEQVKALRGCIGYMVAESPLWVTVAMMAYKAAREDTRFKPIALEELPFIIADITVLEPFTLCPDKEKIIIGKHGIMLEAHGRHAVFLPHVPVEQGWSLEDTLRELCRKAGLPLETWKEDTTKVYWYEGVLLHNDG